jgi:UDP-galactopyranose mutase
MKYEWLVVGAGITGCVMAERIATQLGKRVLLIDKRDHIGGSAHDFYDQHGVLIHKHGPHIFHTSNEAVWQYLSRFTDWRPYEHRVLASLHGHYVPLPFNLRSLRIVFSKRRADILKKALVDAYGQGESVPILHMLEHGNADVRMLGQYVYKTIFENYSRKQWGIAPNALPSSVTGRVPVRISDDDRYFQDIYQCMPAGGFTKMFQRMLANPNIDVELTASFANARLEKRSRYVFFTGPIDEYFGWMHGSLPYRSLRFKCEFFQCERVQPVATVNFPNEHAYTRTTEFKYLTKQRVRGTSVMKEFPEGYELGKNEAYYPIPLPENEERFSLYAREAAKLRGRVVFGGRLADYRYYNMDQAVARALMIFERDIAAGARI